MNKAFMPSCPLFPSDIINHRFHVPIILIYYEKTGILQEKSGQKYKKLLRLYSDAMKI